MSGEPGIIIVDRNGAIFIRKSDQFLQFTTMEKIGNKLVVGANNGNILYYADWNSIYDIPGVSNVALNCVYITKSFDFDIPDCQKQLRRVDVEYKDTKSTAANMTIEYRIDDEIDVNDDETWHTLGTIGIGIDDKTHVASLDCSGLSNVFNFIEFKITASTKIKIMRIFVYYHILSKK